MAEDRSLPVTRFLRLPRRSADTWQGGLVRMPMWVDDGKGSHFRPWGAMWVSIETGLVNAKAGQHPDWALALEVMLELGQRFARTRPSAIEVSDGALGHQLASALGDPELEVRVSADIPIVRDHLRQMAEAAEGRALPPDALDAAGVTVHRMRSFAAAARAFYEAAPWRLLSDADLIHVESPKVERGLGYVTVLGGAGQAFGLGFFATARDFARLEGDSDPDTLTAGAGAWSVLYGPIDELPFGDIDLWDAHALPVAGPSAYPVAMRYGPDGRLTRPSATMLSQMEAILLALAGSSEDEIDRGRWSRTVATADGPCAVVLAIPELLRPLDAPDEPRPGASPDPRAMERVLLEAERFTASTSFASEAELQAALHERFSGPIDKLPSLASTPLDRAQDLAHRAAGARGRRRIQLARKALELSPDCADALVLLAEDAIDPAQAHDLYAQGVAAAERALGPAIFAEEAGHFWIMVGTRPYMRARFGLAQCLETLDRPDEAIAHYRDLIRLNENDNLGVRDTLVATLLRLNRNEEADELLAQFAGDASALWMYASALCAFRREGNSPTARRRLDAAVRANRRAPAYLQRTRTWPGLAPRSYALGSDEEAAIVESVLGELWRATPDAERWLVRHAASGKRRR